MILEKNEKMKELEAQKEKLTDELGLVKDKIRAEWLRLCKEKGVWIGGVVVDKNGRLHRVCQIEHKAMSIWLTGNPLLKDGSFGRREVRLYNDWMLKQ